MRKVSKAEANRRCWLFTIVVVIAIVVAVAGAVADVGKAAVDCLFDCPLWLLLL